MPMKPRPYLGTNETLRTGEYLRSQNHRFLAVMQADGNLCVYRGDTPDASYCSYVWSTGVTDSYGQFFTLMQSDGNLVVYRGTGIQDNHGLIWNSHKTGTGGEYFLVLQDDGNLCVYRGRSPDDAYELLWDSHQFEAVARPDLSSTSTAVNDAIRKAVITGLSKIPEAGGLLAAIAGQLWPDSGQDMWARMRREIEALINQKLTDYKFQDVKDVLAGLHNVINDYARATAPARHQANSYPSEKYNAALAVFLGASPHFTSHGHELLLLPLFAQMANLHLALLRDGVQHGHSWGWEAKDVEQTRSALNAQIQTYGAWVQRWYGVGLDQYPVPATGDNKRAWSNRNHYVRNMTLQVLDIAHYWPSFAPGAAPAGKLTRELYSDPYGSAKAAENPIALTPSVRPRLNGVSIWGGNRIDAVQLRFEGQDWAPRQGNQDGGVNTPPHGWHGDIRPDNPVVEVVGFSGEVAGGLMLIFQDGTRTQLCGRPDGAFYTAFLEGHVLSTIYVSGANRFYGVADAVVFGFRLRDSY